MCVCTKLTCGQLIGLINLLYHKLFIFVREYYCALIYDRRSLIVLINEISVIRLSELIFSHSTDISFVPNLYLFIRE